MKTWGERQWRVHLPNHVCITNMHPHASSKSSNFEGEQTTRSIYMEKEGTGRRESTEKDLTVTEKILELFKEQTMWSEQLLNETKEFSRHLRSSKRSSTSESLILHLKWKLQSIKEECRTINSDTVPLQFTLRLNSLGNMKKRRKGNKMHPRV